MKSYTDIEQSKKLAEILPIESADMCYLSYESLFPKINYNGIVFFNSEEEKPSTIIPCWSLATLLKVIPYPELREQYNGNWTCRVSNANTTFLWEDDNPINACYEMILKLKEKNLL